MTEGGLGDLGFSSESEGVDIAAQTSEASEADFKEYAKSLGVELEKDVDLVWVAREAFEAPLPASWSEHLDQERRIYFFNQVTQQSSWNHPMDEVFRDLLHLIKSVRRLDPPEASVVEAVQTHLQSCHDRASAALEGWSGPYAAEDGEYFYHAEQGVSTWHNPVEEWQTELSVRQQVLHRCLLHESPPNKAANGIARGRGASRDTSPPALPLHLARPMAEGATPPSPSSARSFATCISARSTSITPRSRRPSLCASEAPSRNNSKQRAEMPAQRPEKGPENSGKEGEGAGGEASETGNRPRGLHPPERMVDEELEITFGSGGLTLPQFGQSEGTKE